MQHPDISSTNLPYTTVFDSAEYLTLDEKYDELATNFGYMQMESDPDDEWVFDLAEIHHAEMCLYDMEVEIINLLRQRLAEITNDTSEDANKERHKILQKLKELE